MIYHVEMEYIWKEIKYNVLTSFTNLRIQRNWVNSWPLWQEWEGKAYEDNIQGLKEVDSVKLFITRQASRYYNSTPLYNNINNYLLLFLAITSKHAMTLTIVYCIHQHYPTSTLFSWSIKPELRRMILPKWYSFQGLLCHTSGFFHISFIQVFRHVLDPKHGVVRLR